MVRVERGAALKGNLEYVALRLVRRFLFTDRMLARPWVRALVPHYRTNWNEVDPFPIARRYADFLQERSLPAEARWLEIGVGATNTTGYALAAEMRRRGASGFQITLLEPFVPLAEAIDAQILQRVAAQSGIEASELRAGVCRLTAMPDRAGRGFDAIFSSSVLEHVSDPRGLFADLARVAAPGGRSYHFVDYRDHFFKYPYHFLQFSRATWDRFLNPGDLPRWRLSDHLRLLREGGWDVEVREETSDAAAFAAVAERLAPEFDGTDPLLAVMTAVLVATRPGPPGP